ncbi:hypothetical protein AM10699_41140 [Acaryochloris marina MBIC10699]|nr:hypothetical protein AM10699_41140 [Acaryochloris marina MBIC10699]
MVKTSQVQDRDPLSKEDLTSAEEAKYSIQIDPDVPRGQRKLNLSDCFYWLQQW